VSNYSEYLGRNLNQRAADVAPIINLAVESVMRKAAAAGRLGSGNTLHEFMTESLRVFMEEVQKGLQFAFNLTENNGRENVEALKYFAGRVEAAVIQKIVESSSRLGIAEPTAARQVTDIRAALAEKKERMIDDFAHGMMGEGRLKKDSVVNVVQTNSPGAVQQVGIGQFSQTAFVQNHQPLIAAIDAALSSREFEALSDQDKVGLRDIADIVKAEADKPKPDAGKLKRWGDRLVALTGDLGLKVVSSTIAQILTRMFMGG
jgi:hypothetical protein